MTSTKVYILYPSVYAVVLRLAADPMTRIHLN